MSPNTWISSDAFLAVHKDDRGRKYVYKYKLVGNGEIEKSKLFEASWIPPPNQPFANAAGCLTATAANVYVIKECPVHGPYHHRVLIFSHSGVEKGSLTVPGKILQLSTDNDSASLIFGFRSHRIATFNSLTTFCGSEVPYSACPLEEPWLELPSNRRGSIRDRIILSLYSEETSRTRNLGRPDFGLCTNGSDYSNQEFRVQGPGGLYPDPGFIKRAGESRLFHQPGLHYLLLNSYGMSLTPQIAKVRKNKH